MMRLPRTEYIINDDGEFVLHRESIADCVVSGPSDPLDRPKCASSNSRPQSRTSTASSHTLRAESPIPESSRKATITIDDGGDDEYPTNYEQIEYGGPQNGGHSSERKRTPITKPSTPRSTPYALNFEAHPDPSTFQEQVNFNSSRSRPYAFTPRPRASRQDQENVEPDLPRSRPYAKMFDRQERQSKKENVGNSSGSFGPNRKRARSEPRMENPPPIPSARRGRQSNHGRVQDGRLLIDIDAMAAELEEEFFSDEPLADGSIPQAKSHVPMRNAPVTLPWAKIEGIDIPDRGMTLKSGMTVELSDETFLFIIDIIQNMSTNDVKLRGWQLKRSSDLHGLLRKGLNELCFTFEVELDDPRSIHEQGMIETDTAHVLVVRDLIRTNYPYPGPSNRAKVSGDKKKNVQHWRDHESLVVRWKYITKYDNRAQRLRVNLKYPKNVRQRTFETLTEDECSNGQYLDPLVRRFLWRGETELGGSDIENLVDQVRDRLASDLNLDAASRRAHLNEGDRFRAAAYLKQRYTFGDCFCGAGGTTRGAVLAELRVLWGLDKDGNSGQTWRRNFPSAQHFEAWADEFVSLFAGQEERLKQFVVDVLHMSPPCQVWSPVHTVVGQDDQQNFDSLFACEELLKKAKPRMVTLEQTFGILHPKFSQAFNSVIQMFTFYGYSVSWQLVEFQRWGLAQSRRRLIVVAAGPGETLPDLPPYTHSNLPGDNLRPFTSVREVLRRISRNHANNNINSLKALNKTPWDDRGIATCITCAGGEKGHPSGTRNFTHCELAALQSFPTSHLFYGGAINKQIGNAVPPMIAKIIFKAIIKHLEKADGVEREVHELD
ncbi:uncharacterized protein PAC_15881 [Phialocephala subalpina]|uniref:DNA (cytosine-5-)-methyltransferase n=1 Tax=Phialocephala subalpina TaxID=576137 RepID=A0A1L7XLP8_9HELO|nr:uncharacterized protein PAC_15881 [Phialocephala subalpina]